MIKLKPDSFEFVNETRSVDSSGRVSTNQITETIACYAESGANLQIYVNGKQRNYSFKIVVLGQIADFTHVIISGELMPIIYQKPKQLHTEIYV